MKNIILAIISVVLFAQCTPKIGTDITDNNQESTTSGTPDSDKPGKITDATNFRANAPAAGPAPKIQMGTYESFELQNGLKVIVVENHKVPRVSFQLSLDMDPLYEGDAAGYLDIAGSLMRKGTKNRTKAQLDEEIDFLGASLSTSWSGIFASSLTKHIPTLLDLTSDVLLNPTFPKEEFDKLIKETKSGLQADKDDPNAMMANVADAINYGKNHPYGEVITEATVDKITVDMCKKYYQSYFKPNIAYLVIVGDITPSKAEELATKYFGKWQKGDVKEVLFPIPSAPSSTKVSFVDKAGAVQSVINVTYPVTLKPGTADAIPSSLMNSMLGGGGFSGRLMQNLREDKGYTYGSYSRLGTDELIGYFNAFASVRNEVTDSSVTEILYEMNRLVKEKVTADELAKAKNILTGSFARSLERPQTIARFALNTALYNLPADYYSTYLEKLNAVSVDDVQKMANKYLKTGNANIVVVGNKDEVADKLKKFTKDGTIHYYDRYGDPVKAATTNIADNVSATSIVSKYIDAIGGRQKVQGVKDLYMALTADSPQGPVTVVLNIKSPGKYQQKVEMMGMTVMDVKCDGTKGYQTGMQGSGPVEGKQLEALKKQAKLFPELQYGTDAYKLELKGVETLYGKDAYKIVVTPSSGEASTEFYDVESGLKVKSIEVADLGMGPQSQIFEYENYKDVDGVKFPYIRIQSGQAMKVDEIKVNSGISDDVFKVE